MRWTRKTARRSSSACSTCGSSFSERPPPEDGLTRSASGISRLDIGSLRAPHGGSLIGPRARQALAQPHDQKAAAAGARRSWRSSKPCAGEAAPGAAWPQAEPVAAAALRSTGDQLAARAQDAGDLGDRRGGRAPWATRSKWSSGKGRPRGAADLEGDPALGVEADPGARRRDRLAGGVDAAHPGARELAGEEEGPLAARRSRSRGRARDSSARRAAPPPRGGSSDRARPPADHPRMSSHGVPLGFAGRWKRGLRPALDHLRRLRAGRGGIVAARS